METDNNGYDTTNWALMIAKKYHTYIGVGYIDKEKQDYYNRYLIAGRMASMEASLNLKVNQQFSKR